MRMVTFIKRRALERDSSRTWRVLGWHQEKTFMAFSHWSSLGKCTETGLVTARATWDPTACGALLPKQFRSVGIQPTAWVVLPEKDSAGLWKEQKYAGLFGSSMETQLQWREWATEFWEGADVRTESFSHDKPSYKQTPYATVRWKHTENIFFNELLCLDVFNFLFNFKHWTNKL